MFTTYGAHNYRSSEGLLVWYEQESVTSDGTKFVKVTRHATKSYSFLDMTKTASNACVSALRSKYMRTYATWSLDEGSIVTSTVTERMTDVTASVHESGSRDVSVSVNERDVKYCSPDAGSDYTSLPESLFSTENMRDYDDAICPKTTQGLSVYSSSSNMKVDQDLDILYAVDECKTSLTTYYKYTRYATMRYSFMGMTQATAEGCARAKLYQYMREYGYIDSSASQVSSMNKKKMGFGASVSLNHDGNTWSVAISVNETDVKVDSQLRSATEIFATEDQRVYDGEMGLILTSVTYTEQVEPSSHATISAESKIHGVSLSDCTLKLKTSASPEWIDYSPPVTWSGNTGTTVMPYMPGVVFFACLEGGGTQSELVQVAGGS